MRFGKSSKIASAVLIAGVVAMAATSYVALRTLKIGSPLYGQIILGKDLLADILPPPEYIIESYLEATLALNDPASLEARRERLAALRKDYDARHIYWQAQEFDNEIQAELTQGAHGPAQRFWQITEAEFLPALARRDLDAAKAAYEEMAEAYGAHRVKIDEVVKRSNEFVIATEQRSQAYDAWIMAVVVTLSGVMLALVAVGAWGLSKSLVEPLTHITEAVRTLANGNFSVALPGLGRKDEIGDIAAAVAEFKVKAVEKAEVDARLKQEDTARLVAERKAEMKRLADQFQVAVGKIVEKVLSASTQLEGTANRMAKSSETTQQLSTMVAAASEQTSANVQGVAAASEQLSSTVTEISRQVQESSTMAQAAVEQASKTNARVNELSLSAERIGDVVSLINNIASQTNLLALNATIEAARAGEAGKGFAVVAQEVKALASQTGKATSEIAAQITSMQTATGEAVSAIHEISSTINRLSEYAGAIAAAVEQQGATTQEISRNVSEAAKGTSEVASSISEVLKGASETGAASAQVLSSAQSLSLESGGLKTEVERFLATVRAA